MDPNQTLMDLVSALIEQDSAMVAESGRALCEWLDGGGFAPNVNRTALRTLVGHAIRAACSAEADLPAEPCMSAHEQMLRATIAETEGPSPYAPPCLCGR